MSKATLILAGRYTSRGAAARLAVRQDALAAAAARDCAHRAARAAVRDRLTPALHFARNRALAADLGLAR